MTRALMLPLFLISAFAFGGDSLTEQEKIESYARLAESVEAKITDRGDFMIVSVSPGGEALPGFYFFTKSWHPADPGIVFVQVLVENGESRMVSSGQHGENEEEFKEFHEQVNRAMLQMVKNALNGP